jgi:bifunctional non-homologous end joining protein LigD
VALEEYRRKRDFGKTPEPGGAGQAQVTPGAPGAQGALYIVQKHDARRLHYDFRLEMDGALKSWAVTRGPSLVAGEKRLAVHVEDHPLEYGDFEGTIPKGEYGGGTVILWDRGTWTPLGDAHKGYAKGHLDFQLHGEKLNGRWHLVRMHTKPREKKENWLLIKGDDNYARPGSEADILEERPESAKTRRVIAEVQGESPGWSKTGKIEKPPATKTAESAKATPRAALNSARVKGSKKASLPAFVEPMLASLVTTPPAGERWLHEIKFDGYRLQARIERGDVKLLTRSGVDWTAKFGAGLAASLRALAVKTAIIDGELVVEATSGASDFSALQADLSNARSDRFIFYAFDLLYLDGYDLTASTLDARKGLLEKLVGRSGRTIRYSDDFKESGEVVLRHACRLGLEGVVSKLRDAPYRAGRGKSWVKAKCSARQEFVIGGYTPSTTSAKAIGSLVLGVYENGALRHVGRVGTGFTEAIAKDVFKALDRLRVNSSPFADRLTADEARAIRYVRPELVAEVEFRAWTVDGHLRHASFRGLRDDKPASEIVQEAPKGTVQPKPLPRRVKLTHPDRVYWPDQGVTKEGLADYYTEVWRFMAPFIVGRPLALLRCPNGIDGKKFFQKHAWKGLSPAIVEVKDPTAPAEEPLISINNLDGLMGLVQAAALEIHPWGSTVENWEQPDSLTMDLDPGEDVAWEAVISAAREIEQRLKKAGLAAFVKTSGGKGLHVIAPLKPKADWATVKDFSKGIADAMAADSPNRFVSTITKSKRGGKILIDYLRNQRGSTAVAAYSTRARPGAAVSMPLAWDELSPAIGAAYFTVNNAPARLASLKSDPWDGFRACEAPLGGAAMRKRKPA